MRIARCLKESRDPVIIIRREPVHVSKGAEEDELKLLKMQIDKQNNALAGKKEDVADNKDDGKTRKKSDKNMNNYRKIVIADDSEDTPYYKNDYRGRVQDRNIIIKLEPMYVLTYYEKQNDHSHYNRFGRIRLCQYGGGTRHY